MHTSRSFISQRVKAPPRRHPQRLAVAASSAPPPKESQETGADPSYRPLISTSKRLVLLSSATLLSLGASSSLPVPPALAGGEKTVIPVSSLPVISKQRQRAAFLARVQSDLAGVLDVSDSADLVRLCLAEASTYDALTQDKQAQYGFDGSIFYCEKEAASLDAETKRVMDKLREAKQRIDAHPDAPKTGPISYADLLALGTKVAITKEWTAYRLKKAGKESKARILQQGYSTNWNPRFGRVDSKDCPAAPSRLPPRDASPQEILDFFERLGNKEYGQPKGGFFARLPPFSAQKAFLLWTQASKDPEAEGARLGAVIPEFEAARKKYESSKRTTTRATYEVDSQEVVEQLTLLGCKTNSDAYLYAEESARIKL